MCVEGFLKYGMSRKSNSEGTALSRLRNTLEITAVEAMTVYFAEEKYWFALCLFLLWHKAQHDEMHISYFYEWGGLCFRFLSSDWTMNVCMHGENISSNKAAVHAPTYHFDSLVNMKKILQKIRFTVLHTPENLQELHLSCFWGHKQGFCNFTLTWTGIHEKLRENFIHLN